jgi:hypothetical protein
MRLSGALSAGISLRTIDCKPAAVLFSGTLNVSRNKIMVANASITASGSAKSRLVMNSRATAPARSIAVLLFPGTGAKPMESATFSGRLKAARAAGQQSHVAQSVAHGPRTAV